ncbi:MAG TPA: class I SAM-dependent methyltransferase [Bryobacteraceae bacterium]|nr:class I SAM-dependent methyltransferase [Bryobacteraceae bacterium]
MRAVHFEQRGAGGLPVIDSGVDGPDEQEDDSSNGQAKGYCGQRNRSHPGRPSELVYDLGSGNGRVLITAVQRFKARAVGIELSDDLARISTEKIARLGLQSDARVINADVRNVDLSPADVVIMYLETDFNEKLSVPDASRKAVAVFKLWASHRAPRARMRPEP